jgi:hypothetical protein
MLARSTDKTIRPTTKMLELEISINGMEYSKKCSKIKPCLLLRMENYIIRF